jgi:hypothetical protein
MFKCVFLLFGIGIFLLVPSCAKHPTSSTPVPVSKYAPYWGLWEATYQSNPETGKFKLHLNQDTTFSISQVVDSNGAVFNPDSGTYTMDTGSKILRLVASGYEGDYSYAYDSLVLSLRLTWVSGDHDYMFAQDRTTAVWEFFKH